jgi:hypothetical protein
LKLLLHYLQNAKLNGSKSCDFQNLSATADNTGDNEKRVSVTANRLQTMKKRLSATADRLHGD